MEQMDLASLSNVARSTIGAFEIKDESARLSTRINRALIEAFERAGLQFIPENGGGPGIRLRHPIGRGSSPSDQSRVEKDA
jgi:hypothetical protein